MIFISSDLVQIPIKELLLLLIIIVTSQLIPWFLTVSVWAEMHDSTHNTILLDPLSMENERHHSN